MLIPAPRLLEERAGAWALPADLRIAVAGPDEYDAFLIRHLCEQLREAGGRAGRVAEAGGEADIVLVRAGGDSAVGEERAGRPRAPMEREAVAALEELPAAGWEEGYSLVVSPRGVAIAAATNAGLFYGVQTLVQLVRAAAGGPVACRRIVDWPALRYRGWQDDISRGPIPTLDHLKRQVRALAAFKLNLLTLYTEHVFRLDRHPRLAPADGLTAGEVRELVAYARDYQVEIAGNFQSFGHFQHILSTPGYEHLGEAGRVLSPAVEESYAFLADAFAEIAPAYASPLFVINCDETEGLGGGASRELVEREGIGEVYARHIARVAELLRAHGKTPLMWGDIALHHREIVPKLPRGLIVLSWGYEPADSFEQRVRPFAELGLPVIVCPGVQCWKRLWPDLPAALVNIARFVRDGERHGAIGMLNTTWDDDGENLFAYNWLPLAWGAAAAWNPQDAAARLETGLQSAAVGQWLAGFERQFFGSEGKGVAGAMLRLSTAGENELAAGLQTQWIWRDAYDVAAREGADRAARELDELCSEAIEELRAARETAAANADVLDAATFAARRLRLLAGRVRAIRALRWAARGKLEEVAVQRSVTALVDEARALRAEYERLWRRESRESSLERVLRRFDGLTDSLVRLAGGVLLEPSDVELLPAGGEVRAQPLRRGAVVRYTSDGSEPGAHSPRLDRPLRIEQTTTIRARALFEDAPPGPLAEARYVVLPWAAGIVTSLPVNKDHYAKRAFDPSPDEYFWSRRELRTGDELGLRFERPVRLRHVRVETGTARQPYHILHRGVLEISEDGERFEAVGRFEHGAVSVALAGRPVSAVRLRAVADQAFWLIVRRFELE